MGRKVTIEVIRDIEAKYERPTYKTRGVLGSTEGTTDKGTHADANPAFALIGFLVVIGLIGLFVASLFGSQSRESEPVRDPVPVNETVPAPASPSPVAALPAEPSRVEPVPEPLTVEQEPIVAHLGPPVEELSAAPRFEPPYASTPVAAQKMSDIDMEVESVELLLQQFPPSLEDEYRGFVRAALERTPRVAWKHAMKNIRANLQMDLDKLYVTEMSSRE